ncbi:MAG: LysR family transcriptional regulator [Pseudomonadota bacterium]
MNGATYNQLLTFQAIVAEGSIRGAARKLELSPPSVSQSLRNLETTVGLPLFARTTRRIELTEAGQLLRDRTSATLSSLEYAIESVRDLGDVPSGKVRITLPRFVYHLFLRPAYADFCALYPGVELEISLSDAVVNLISEGFDLGIRLGDRIEEGMVAKRLSPPMREALVASPDYLRRHGTPKTLADLRKHRLVQYRFIASNRLAPLDLIDGGRTVNVEMPTALVVNDTEVMVDAAVAGLGIGRIVEPVVAAALKAGSIKPVLKKHWMPYPALYAYFPQHTQKARRVRALIDFLSEKALKRW